MRRLRHIARRVMCIPCFPYTKHRSYRAGRFTFKIAVPFRPKGPGNFKLTILSV